MIKRTYRRLALVIPFTPAHDDKDPIWSNLTITAISAKANIIVGENSADLVIKGEPLLKFHDGWASVVLTGNFEDEDVSYVVPCVSNGHIA